MARHRCLVLSSGSEARGFRCQLTFQEFCCPGIRLDPASRSGSHLELGVTCELRGARWHESNDHGIDLLEARLLVRAAACAVYNLFVCVRATRCHTCGPIPNLRTHLKRYDAMRCNTIRSSGTLTLVWPTIGTSSSGFHATRQMCSCTCTS